MFGTSDKPSREDRALIRVLDRQCDIPALRRLIAAIGPAEEAAAELTETAIGLDSSVFLRLASHAKSADIIDYFSGRHSAPLILPGQAVQEFWNNQLQAVDTISSSLRKKFDAFRAEFEGIDPGFGEYSGKVVSLLDEFSAEHGHVYEEGTVRETGRLLDTLQRTAIVPFVSRAQFDPFAQQRKRTKTPPGFKDDGDGDFFIWADMLRGLQLARKRRLHFSKVVLVTEDKKKDWSRAGLPHPMLAAEIAALFNAPFQIWNLARLANEVAHVLQTSPNDAVD